MLRRLFPRLRWVWMCVGLVCGAVPAQAARPWAGVVSHVIDGDTLSVRPARGGAEQRVRLQGLDAPEICQPWGTQARQALADQVLHRHVRVQVRAHDAYGRLVALVRVEGEDIGAWMVGRGHAWSDSWRGRRGRYDALEAAARRDGRGLFALVRPEHPADFRHRYGGCHAPVDGLRL